MLDMTLIDVILLVWAGVASGMAWHYKERTHTQAKLLEGATICVTRLVVDDKYRDKLRKIKELAERDSDET